MTSANEAHALVDSLFGPSDEAADRVVTVLDAQLAALAWVHEMTGRYPAPSPVAAHLDSVARRLRSGEVTGDPVLILRQAAGDALASYRPATAA